MAGAFTTVNLSLLPPPPIVEPLDYETVLAAMIADLQARDPTFTALVESDPAYKILEVAAYREVLIRQRVNDAAYGVMLAFASAGDLDQIGANFNVQRLVIDEGNPDVVPPVPPTYESDADFRARIQLSFEGFTTAGSEGSYVFHGLSADADVKDIQAYGPPETPGVVEVYVLSRTDDGTASSELIDIVEAALNAEDVRPLTDQVNVQSADVTPYTIEAVLTLYPGPDPEVVLEAAQTAVEEYAASVHRVGFNVAVSGIMKALHQPGVMTVNLIQPAADIVNEVGEASYCNAYDITAEEVTDV